MNSRAGEFDIAIPGLEFVFEGRGSLGEPLIIGETHEGLRRIIPILEGSFEGPHLRGSFVPQGAADWQFLRPDDVTQAEATYALRTDDDVLIQVSNFGLRHGPEAVMQRLAGGEDVDPSEYYFRTAMRLTAPRGKYDWLNRNIFIGSGARFAAGIRLKVYRVT
jgi:hypothetical protein